MSILDLGLGMAGMSAKEIADLKAGLPTLAALAAEAKELEPILEKARPHIEAIAPHVQALLPLIAQGMPTAQKMWPQVVAVTPLLQEMIVFARSKG